MSFPLFGVLAAAALATTGLGVTGETRSAASLPARNLALVQMPIGPSGKYPAVRHLTDATDVSSDEGKCERDGGDWDSKHRRCRRGGWWLTSGSRYLIGLATVTGIVLAVSDSGTGSHHGSVSN